MATKTEKPKPRAEKQEGPLKVHGDPLVPSKPVGQKPPKKKG